MMVLLVVTVTTIPMAYDATVSSFMFSNDFLIKNKMSERKLINFATTSSTIKFMS
jgi:hypothetical protein